EDEPTATTNAAQATRLYIPSIVMGELFFGAYASQRIKENIARARNYSTHTEVLEVSSETADHYGRIKAELKRIGKPIPENDIWIAAISLQHNLTLVSRDKHFEQVADLSLEQW
ncbi:MAG: type II toxin-antitoxin system VapC family toxin, partial [Bacteroidota bacterium]